MKAIVTILTDFGLSDSYVGVMKGVMLKINPELKFVDITHSIPQGNIKKAAFQLFTAYKYFPKSTIHLVVVDPGVGTKRNPIIVETNDYHFVGPDNGVFSWIYENEDFKVYKIMEISSLISNTFHGRDVFAPIAAKLSLRIKPSELGNLLNQWVKFKPPKPIIKSNTIRGEVLDIDGFGNIITNVPKSVFEAIAKTNFKIKIKNCVIKEIKTSYMQNHRFCTPKLGKSPIAIFGSAGFLEISLPSGNCAKLLNSKAGTKISIKYNLYKKT
ncbi:MAG: SAM-dependent chlorinase/fluorinase [bacterium]|nr:SAM-dependent chlorinase/fluorinase [bacterium]